jgi:hypothetical protein
MTIGSEIKTSKHFTVSSFKQKCPNSVDPTQIQHSRFPKNIVFTDAQALKFTHFTHHAAEESFHWLDSRN